jgi:putative membrane protein
MQLLTKILIATLANAVGLYLADRYIDGFSLLTADLKEIAIIALILTTLNLLLKPILKLILGPFIVITLGFGIIIVNALLLFTLDILFESLRIQGILALIYGALLIGLVNFVFHLIFRNK